MFGFALFNPVVGLRDLFLGREGAEPAAEPAAESAAKKDPLINFPGPEELETYPAPASFVVQGDVCNQFQSPLFGKIPAEIRNEIFRLALTEYVPEGNEWTGKLGKIGNREWGNVYSTESYVDRPGYEGLKTVDTDLLRTCKRVRRLSCCCSL